MSEKYVAGDVVVLKSGGPNMTVKGRYSPGLTPEADTYTCQWFGGKKLESGHFHADSLKRVVENAPNANADVK